MPQGLDFEVYTVWMFPHGPPILMFSFLSYPSLAQPLSPPHPIGVSQTPYLLSRSWIQSSLHSNIQVAALISFFWCLAGFQS